jgi:hypothetical protein
VGSGRRTLTDVQDLEIVCMTDDDPYAEFKRHRLASEAPAVMERRLPYESRKIRKRQQQFVKVPCVWMDRLSGARRMSTYRIALLVLHMHWKRHGQPFVLANGTLAAQGVNRWAKWDALGELEALGLITIVRRRRKSPIVRVNVEL